MKTQITSRAKHCASALITALVICTIFSMFLVSYLTLIEQQNALSGRSQNWNMAMSITEAGVEEAMQHLNSNQANLARDGWTAVGTGTYYRSNALPDGNSYTVYITNGINPIIISRAYVKSGTLAQYAPQNFFAAAGVNTEPVTVTRAVRVTCSKRGLPAGALVARRGINLNGNNVKTDSFDSSDPAKSTNGLYDPSKAGDKGDIASNDGLVNTLNIGNANIYGKAHTGPGTNTITVGSQGGVGSHEWQANNRGIQDGWFLQDANFTFPDTSFPNTSSYLTPTGGMVISCTNNLSFYTTNVTTYPNPPPAGLMTNYTTVVQRSENYPAPGTFVGTPSKRFGDWFYDRITGVSGYSYRVYSTNSIYTTNYYDHVLVGTSGNNTNYYVANNLTGKAIVTGSNVVLALPNGLSMNGNDSLTIMPNANVIVYSGGTSCTIGGNGVINQPGYAGCFMLVCAPTVTSFTLNGNGTFCGVLIAPNVDIRMNGGGNNVVDFVGMLMVNSCTMNGHFNFHYDEALRNMAGLDRFLIDTWNEVP